MDEKEEMSPGEKFVRDAFEKHLLDKPTFEEDMQKIIEEELLRLQKEREEWLKTHNLS